MPYEPWLRPTGETLDAYDGHKKWPPVQWAWEFLRRNDDFKEACLALEQAPNQEVDAQKIAQEFGLKKFKDYRDNYDGVDGKPRFEGRIAFIRNLSETPEPTGRVLSARPGTIVIRFDLHGALNRKGGLSEQIKSATHILQKGLDRYRTEGNKKAINKKGPEHPTLLLRLRLLDLLAPPKKRTQVDAIKIAYGEDHKMTEKLSDLDDATIRDNHKEKIYEAQRLAHEGYRSLAAIASFRKN